MEYNVYHPAPALARYIKCYWTLEMDAVPGPEATQRIFPDGCIELIFQFRDLFEQQKNNLNDLQPRCFVHGQLHQYIDLAPTGNVSTLGVRFRPFGLQPFLPCSTASLTERSVSVADIWNGAGDQLADEVLHARTSTQRISTIEKFLLRRLNNNNINSDRVEWCTAAIARSNGNIAIEQLSQEVNMSRRQLERQFAAHVGLSPKLYSRITRFHQAMQAIEQNTQPSLTALAYDRGFYDQPHFIRDFKTFTGMSPRQYYADRPEMAALFLAQ